MTPEQIAFGILAVLTLGGGAMVAFSSRIIYAAFSLVFTFLGVAGMYVLLAADFLAVAQLILYVGGILVLILFGVMLTQRIYDVRLKAQRIQPLIGGITAIAVAALLIFVVFTTRWNAITPGEPVPTTAAIGHGFMKEFVYPFELVSVVLLIALIGVALIARRSNAGVSERKESASKDTGSGPTSNAGEGGAQ